MVEMVARSLGRRWAVEQVVEAVLAPVAWAELVVLASILLRAADLGAVDRMVVPAPQARALVAVLGAMVAMALAAPAMALDRPVLHRLMVPLAHQVVVEAAAREIRLQLLRWLDPGLAAATILRLMEHMDLVAVVEAAAASQAMLQRLRTEVQEA